MSVFQDLKNQRFGRLLIKERAHGKRPGTYWICHCDCGNTITAAAAELKRGHVLSCKCLRSELKRAQLYKHGKWQTTEFTIWQGMKQRCNDPNFKFYDRYGGRGIKVCPEWATDFENFLRDMGPRPSKDYSLDRKDVNGNYEPGNCRWATRLEQANNTRTTFYVSYNGKTISLGDAIRASGSTIDHRAVYARIVKLGWTLDRALTIPKHTFTRRRPVKSEGAHQ